MKRLIGAFLLHVLGFEEKQPHHVFQFSTNGGNAEQSLTCSVCSGEGKSLTTDCSGYQLDINRLYEIHKGLLDFKNGVWVIYCR